MSQKWIDLENHHRVSKTAAEDFWRVAKEQFPRLHRARVNARVYKDIPQFGNQRRKLYKSNVPPVKLEIGYLNRGTQEIVKVEGDKTPVSRFNPRQFEKLFEVATVEVN